MDITWPPPWLSTASTSHPLNLPANSPSNPVLAGAVHNVLNPPQVPPFSMPGMPPPGVQFQQVSFQVQQQHGLFPPPEAIQAYEKILPGTFDRIIRMAEKAQQDQTDTVVAANSSIQKDTRRGQMLGALISLAGMGCGMWCVLLQQPLVAAVFVSLPVMGVAKALIDSARAAKPNPTPPPQPPPTAAP